MRRVQGSDRINGPIDRSEDTDAVRLAPPPPPDGAASLLRHTTHFSHFLAFPDTLHRPDDDGSLLPHTTHIRHVRATDGTMHHSRCCGIVPAEIGTLICTCTLPRRRAFPQRGDLSVHGGIQAISKVFTTPHDTRQSFHRRVERQSVIFGPRLSAKA